MDSRSGSSKKYGCYRRRARRKGTHHLFRHSPSIPRAVRSHVQIPVQRVAVRQFDSRRTWLGKFVRWTSIGGCPMRGGLSGTSNRQNIRRWPIWSSTRLRMLSLSLLFLAQTGAAQAPTYEPVGTILQLMNGIIVPASNAVFKAPNDPPKDDKEWAVIQNNALLLAESGNLLIVPGRAKDDGEWIKDSRALIDAGSVALKAANAKDIDGVTLAGDPIL